MSHHRKAKHAAHDEGHESHERWLITYADMITLLMVLFIVLFAISQVDLAKFQRLKSGLAKNFGVKEDAGVLDGRVQLLTNGDNLGPGEIDAALTGASSETSRKVGPGGSLEEVRDQLVAQLTDVGLGEKVTLQISTRGLIVTIVTDQVLFESGSATVKPESYPLLDDVAGVLAGIPNPLTIEGHTDNVPITGGPFPSNWELSTARATAVLRTLIDHYGFAPPRLSAAGYADQHPIASNDTPDGRAANRRVEIVVRSIEDRNSQETS